ncbi:hypothetical protein N7450_004325 [Penicillium hetheringtonii]|uniref:Uncharacterized protein n=1 Tax=Penicillium hetheringtonii TaxID=911720 RepID=A0AAD6GUA6_9EURO|nr:hypothetical protein N7450_004325 [Penicillium hetheringtonii]
MEISHFEDQRTLARSTHIRIRDTLTLRHRCLETGDVRHYTKVLGIPTGDDDALPEHCSNGTRALRKWVLLGGWRKASYESQPYRRPVHSLIGRYCDFLEEFA